MASNERTHPRLVLQFTDYDFRHRKVLEVLRSQPRNMTSLVVNAVMHFISCPNAGDEFGKEMVRNTVKEVLFEMISDGTLAGITAQQPQSTKSGFSKEDASALSDLMSAFR